MSVGFSVDIKLFDLNLHMHTLNKELSCKKEILVNQGYIRLYHTFVFILYCVRSL